MVEGREELVEVVVVEHVLEMEAEMTEEMAVAHKFSMKKVPLLVGESLEKLQLYRKQLCYPWLLFIRTKPLPRRSRRHCLLGVSLEKNAPFLCYLWSF